MRTETKLVALTSKREMIKEFRRVVRFANLFTPYRRAYIYGQRFIAEVASDAGHTMYGVTVVRKDDAGFWDYDRDDSQAFLDAATQSARDAAFEYGEYLLREEEDTQTDGIEV